MNMFTKFQDDVFNSRTPAALRTRRRILLSSTVYKVKSEKKSALQKSIHSPAGLSTSENDIYRIVLQ